MAIETYKISDDDIQEMIILNGKIKTIGELLMATDAGDFSNTGDEVY